MKRITISVIILLLALPLMAQEEEAKPSREEKKALKKEQKKQTEMLMAAKTGEAIRTGYFVLRADQVKGHYGNVVNVNPTLNFIAVEGQDVYVQLGSEAGIGYNGVGGITLKGQLINYKVRQDKHGSYNLIFEAMGTPASLTITMNVNLTGDIAGATVKTNWGSRVDYMGELQPLRESGIYKGKEEL